MAEFSLPHDHGACLTEASLKCQLDKPQTFQAVADLFKLLDDCIFFLILCVFFKF